MDPIEPAKMTETEQQRIEMMHDFSELFDSECDIENDFRWSEKDQRWELRVGGFYKEGEAIVYRDPRQNSRISDIHLYRKYQVEFRLRFEYVRNFDGLVDLNFLIWQITRSCYHAGGWIDPDNGWRPYLERSGRIKKDAKTEYLSATETLDN